MPSATSDTVMAVDLDRSLASMLSRSGSRCCTRTKAKPLSRGSAARSSRNASNPPADAPTPTTGQGVPGAGPSGEAGTILVAPVLALLLALLLAVFLAVEVAADLAGFMGDRRVFLLAMNRLQWRGAPRRTSSSVRRRPFRLRAGERGWLAEIAKIPVYLSRRLNRPRDRDQEE